METRIFLIGFMASGKSTIGSRLARNIGYRFLDMDALIEETAGMTIPGIFSEYGEEVFRNWEKKMLHEIVAREKVVVSTGGGAPCHGGLMELMNAHGDTVYISLPPDVLMQRLLHSKTERPLIKGKDPDELLSYIRSKLAEREPFYSRAIFTVDGTGLDLPGLVKLLRSKDP